jgi:hypothetical protein
VALASARRAAPVDLRLLLV